ncbi:MAG: DUF2855 family protein [Pseudomonadota bacterium]
MSDQVQQFQVRRDALAETRMISSDPAPLAAGEARLAVERFALTANNITYGVAGDMIGYWQFFPASDGFGCIPVWGIARVAESNHPDVAAGTRCYGYFPMGTELIVKPEKVSERGFTDATEHRAQLPVVYNQYSTVAPEYGFAHGLDNHAMLYRPLFTTSFVLDDWLADNDDFGAEAVVIGSASSKTGFGLAFMLKRRGEGAPTVVGLTSPANRAFVAGLGLYDEVLTYDEADALTQRPTAYVDMAGNRSVLSAVHRRLADDLVCSCGVGITHWDARDGADPAELPGAKPTMFFAPTQIVKRNEELGPVEYQRRIGDATGAFFAQVDGWVQVEESPGAEIATVYQTVLAGAAPDKGYVVSFA